jgi:hypothetical protein
MRWECLPAERDLSAVLLCIDWVTGKKYKSIAQFRNKGKNCGHTRATNGSTGNILN